MGPSSNPANHLNDFFKEWTNNYLTDDANKTNRLLQELGDDPEAFLGVRKGRPKNVSNRRGRKRDVGTDVKNKILP